MEVNYFGVARVCEAFIPLLEDAGRIVNISSFGAQAQFTHKDLQIVKSYF